MNPAQLRPHPTAHPGQYSISGGDTAGRTSSFGNSATTAWTTLPIHPSFVPLLIRMISYVTSGLGENLNISPGLPFAIPVDSEFAGKEFSVLDLFRAG